MKTIKIALATFTYFQGIRQGSEMVFPEKCFNANNERIVVMFMIAGL